MTSRLAPKVIAHQLVRVLRPQQPDYHYLKKVFQYTRDLFAVGPVPRPKRLPNLLTEAELVALYEAIWHAQHLTHLVMLKLLLYTGIRNAELVWLRLTDVDLQTCYLRIDQGKGHKDRHVLFPTHFRGELAQYVERQRAQGTVHCLNRGGVNPTPHGVSARLSNGVRSQLGSRNASTPISPGISCSPI